MAGCACVLFLSDVALEGGPAWLFRAYEHMRACLPEVVSILLIAGSSPASSSAVIKKGRTLAGTICCAQVEVMVRAIGGVVVDSRSCDSKGGCCDSRRSLCSTPFPCQERHALAIGQGQGQQCAAGRTSVRLLPAAGGTHSQSWDGEARSDGFDKSGLCTGEAVRRLGLSGQGLLVLSPDTIVRPPGPPKEPGHAWRLQLRA
eukprot:scaffold6569_cov122-Isochrysis_galbana.AAC.3